MYRFTWVDDKTLVKTNGTGISCPCWVCPTDWHQHWPHRLTPHALGDLVITCTRPTRPAAESLHRKRFASSYGQSSFSSCTIHTLLTSTDWSFITWTPQSMLGHRSLHPAPPLTPFLPTFLISSRKLRQITCTKWITCGMLSVRNSATPFLFYVLSLPNGLPLGVYLPWPESERSSFIRRCWSKEL